MNKKITVAIMAFTVIVIGIIIVAYQTGYQNFSGSNTASKVVILADPTTETTNIQPGSSIFSPFTVAVLGLVLVACVPITLKILNHHSKNKLISTTKNARRKKLSQE